MTTKLAQHLQETTPLTGLDRATLVVMANRADENGELQTTSTDLATELDCEPSEVRRSVKRLILLGCVSRHGDWFLVHGDERDWTEKEEGGTVSVANRGEEIPRDSTEPGDSTERSANADSLTLAGMGSTHTEERLNETVPTVVTVGDAVNEVLSGKKSAPRKPKLDYLFENLCVISGVDYRTLTKAERSRLNDATKQLKDVGASPQDILDRAGRWHHVFPGATLTAHAIVANWSTLDPKNGTPREEERERPQPTNTILDEDLVTDRTPEGRARAVNHIRQIRETLRASSRPG